MAPYATFGGYAQLPRYQYENLNPQAFQYSHVPTYAPPPVHPALEPPADHPVEKDDGAVANDQAGSSPAEGSGSPNGEGSPGEEKVETSETPQAVPEDEAPVDEVLTAEPTSDGDGTGVISDDVIGTEAHTQESSESSGNLESVADTAPTDPDVSDRGNEGGDNTPKEADFPPIEPGEAEEDAKGGEPVVNAPADEVVEAAPITSPEAAPVVDPTPDAATTEQLPPATAEPADDKSGKRSKKSSKTKEKESKSKSKAKEKEKAREEKEKAKDKAKEKEKEKAKSSGKKKKGKAKVDSVGLPNDEAGPTPDESCPPDASAVEIQADAVAAPAAETTIDPPTETPTDPPTESPTDPPTETPTDPPTETPPEPVINSESSQSEGATANTEASSLDEKQNGPDQVSEPGNEAGTKDLTREGAITTPETEGNLNNESSTPITEEAKSSESANVKVATPNDSSEATQPSTGIDTNPTAPPTTNDDDVANDAPLDVSDTNPLSGPVNVEIVEVIEHIAKDKTPEASPSEVPNDMTPTPEATETKEEKIEVTQPLPKEEDPKAEEQPDLGPETEMAAVEPTSEPSATETIQETPQAEVLDESPPENTQAGDGKSEDQPIETSQAETTETAPQDPSLDGPSGSAPEAVKADDKKMEIVEPPLQSGDVKAEEQPIDVTQEGAAIVDTEATDSAIEAQIEEQPAADEPPTQVAPAGDEEKNDKVTTDWNEEQPAVEADKPPAEILPAVDNEKDDTAIEGRTQEQLAVDKPPAEIAPAADNENNDKAIEDLIQKQPTADELPIEMVTGLVDEKNDKTIVDQIQKEPAADQSPLEIVAVVVDEKAVEAAPAEIPPPVEPSAPVEQTSDPPCVDDAHKGELIEQISTEIAPSEPALVEEPNTGPVVESAPTVDAPPSPNSEKHRRKKAAGWERPRGHSKTSTAGSDLNGSTTKTGPLSDKPASESTATKQKRHSNRRTFELNFGGKGTDHGSSDRPKISRAATSRRSHRREREPESAVKPRILERVKTEADGRVQYRVNDPAAERPSRRRGEESFRREHRSDKHRDGDRHREREREREREKERETEREREREKEREEAKERERERERKRLEEEEERRERRRRRREEEDGRGKDGEGRERHHRHREHDRERRRRDPSPAPAKKTGKSFGSSLRKLLAI